MQVQRQLEAGQVIRFGAFRLWPQQRTLCHGHTPVVIGSRALDLLVALVVHAGAVVSKETLIQAVWPASVVEEINLRVHIAALRKVLGDGVGGQRYIVNVPQRGYSFVAEVWLDDGQVEPTAADRVPPSGSGLPVRLTPVIGRDAVVGQLVDELPHKRFITLLGPGGIGKTTVALQAAASLKPQYADGICLLDLAAVTDADALPVMLAAQTRQSYIAGTPLTALVVPLRERQMLLILDNCEHLLPAVIPFVETLRGLAPGIHVLATSRELLGAAGEHIQRLDALPYPMADAGAEVDVEDYPALALFIDRVLAADDQFTLDRERLGCVAEICRRLDGIPLAIELAAAQAANLGLRGLLAQLDDCFLILTQGKRTALPRQATLKATLDWSYALLADDERACLRRLAIFRGPFRLNDAVSVVSDAGCETRQVAMLVAQLVDKSLINVAMDDGEVVHRLLEITRVYARQQLRASGECLACAARHAAVCLRWLQDACHAVMRDGDERWPSRFGRYVPDVRGALDWSFGAGGDAVMAVRLTLAAYPLWQGLRRTDEFRVYLRLARIEAERHPLPEALGAALATLYDAGTITPDD